MHRTSWGDLWDVEGGRERHCCSCSVCHVWLWYHICLGTVRLGGHISDYRAPAPQCICQIRGDEICLLAIDFHSHIGHLGSLVGLLVFHGEGQGSPFPVHPPPPPVEMTGGQAWYIPHHLLTWRQIKRKYSASILTTTCFSGIYYLLFFFYSGTRVRRRL